MAFTITGSIHDLDGDATAGARVTVSSRLSWGADEHGLTVGPASIPTDESGAIPTGWTIHADEGTPLWLQVQGLSVYASFVAPADETVLTLRGIFEENVPRPVPASSPLVKGDRGASAYEVAVAAGFVGSEAEWLASLEGPRGNTGRGIASVADPDGDGTATVTYDDGATQPLPLPRGPKGDKGDKGLSIVPDPDMPGLYIMRGTPLVADADGLYPITSIGA